MLLIRSDGLQKSKLQAFDSWPLICQFITGEFQVFGLSSYKCSTTKKETYGRFKGDMPASTQWVDLVLTEHFGHRFMGCVTVIV